MITDDLHRALIRALSVLYFGSDEFMQQLAENEFADCASTQRDKLTPLKEILDSDLPKRDKNMTSKQAILEMLKGKKITRTHWMPDMYLEYVDGYFRNSRDGSEYSFKDRPDYGWEIV